MTIIYVTLFVFVYNKIVVHTLFLFLFFSLYSGMKLLLGFHWHLSGLGGGGEGFLL